jgi:ketosteroid isomerase-like protein
MSGGAPPSRLAIAQKFLTHIGHRDFEEVLDLLAPNAVYRAPGHHELAGVFTGRDEISAHLQTLFERTQGTFDTLKWEDWMLGEYHVAALADVHVQIQGYRYNSRHLMLVRFEGDDKIAEIILFFEDERSLERLFGL